MNARYCSKCGAEQGPEARFCWACGQAVVAVSAPPPVAPAPSTSAHPAPAPAAESTVFEFRPLAIRTMRECLLCILTLGIGWVCWRIARMGQSYRITTQRIEIRQGVLTKRRNTLDLFRVEDFEILEPLFLRLRGSGNIRIWSMDKSQPEFMLAAVPDVQTVYEKLRELTRTERGRHQVRVIEGM
jgi:hypothetical protein